MKKTYHWLIRRNYLLTAAIVLTMAGRSTGQCTITIPAIGSSFSNTTVINNNDTTIPYYATAYVWICAGDTVYDSYGEGGGGGPGTEGIFFLEKNAAFIYTGGGAEYTIYAKAGSYYHGSGNDWVYADSTAIIAPGSAGGCCGAVYEICPQLVFDYTNITPGTGCLVSAPAPIAGFSATPLNICAGSSVTFTDSSMDGPTSWKWTFQGGTPGSSSSPTPVITYDTAGTFNVKLVVTNASGSDSLTKTAYISVTSSPKSGTISASSDTLCAGNTSTLTVTGSTGTVQWQSSNGGSFSNIQGATDTFYNAFALTLNTGFRIIAANGICEDTSAALQVTVNRTPIRPVISTSDSAICPGDSTYIAAESGYSSYQWNNGANRAFIYVDTSGYYWVTVADANGCTAVSDSLHIFEYPISTVSITNIGDTLFSFGFTSYQWYNNGLPIPGATDSLYVYNCPMAYYTFMLQATDINGCKAFSEGISVICEGIASISESSRLNIYPDPFTNSLSIKEENASLVIQKITIYDLLGRIEFNKEYNTYPGELQNLDVSALPPGVYFVKISTSDGELVKPVVKQ